MFCGDTLLFSVDKLPTPSYQMTNSVSTISFTAMDPPSIQTNDVQQPAVQMVIDLLIKRKIKAMNYVQLGRTSNYYDPTPQLLVDRGRPLDLRVYLGFTSAVNPTRDGLQMRVDLAHRVMSRKSVRDVMSDIELRMRGRQPSEIHTAVNNELKGAVIVAEYNHRIWRIDQVDYNLSINSLMPSRDGKNIPFSQYYKEHYNRDAPDRRGLLVHIDKKKPTNLTYLIPDFCFITGMSDRLRNDHKVMQALSNHTRKSPSERANTVKKLIVKLLKGEGEESDRERKAMNEIIKVEGDCSKVRGRVLGPFEIKFKNAPGAHRVVDGKGFLREVRDFGYFPAPNTYTENSSSSTSYPSANSSSSRAATITLDKWCYVYDESQARSATNFLGIFRDVARQQGVLLPDALKFVVKNADSRGNPNTAAWESVFNRDVVPANPDFVLFHIPFGDEGIYSLVKHICTITNAIVSQGVSSKTVDDHKKVRPVAGNTLKQIMAKIGYGLWYVSGMVDKMTDCMIVGMDVCHEGKSKFVYGSEPMGTVAGDKMSAVGFCASYDKNYSSWHSFVAFQEKNDDYVHSAKKLMVLALDSYAKKNNCFPKSIIVYRGGVGASQLESFVRKEIINFELAFSACQIQPPPLLSVIVVQKLNNVRLYAECPRYNRKGNCTQQGCRGEVPLHTPPAGTVIDHSITSPLFHDFYMTPTTPPANATARPTRFINVRDDMKWSQDELQSLTYRLCFGYYNWNGAIRVPAPTLYAHKLATMMGKYVRGHPNEKWNGQMFFL